MINIPDEIKELCKKDSVSKNFRISFPNGEHRDLTNADLVSESVILTESVGSTNNFKFGNCEGATLEFRTTFNENIKNLKIKADVEIDVTGTPVTRVIEIPLKQTSAEVPATYGYDIPVQGNYTFELIDASIEAGTTPFIYVYRRGVSRPDTLYLDQRITYSLESGDRITLQTVGAPPYLGSYSIELTLVSTELLPEGAQTSSDVAFPFYRIPYGIFYVDSCKRDAVNNVRQVIAYQNKYSSNSDDLSIGGTSIELSTFDKLKFNSEADSNTFYFNPLLAYCCRFNDVDWLLELIESFPGICSDVVVNDNYNGIMCTSLSKNYYRLFNFDEFFHRYNYEEMLSSGYRHMSIRTGISSTDIKLGVYGIGLNFTMLQWLNACRGQCKGALYAYNDNDPDLSYNYIAFPSEDLYEFKWQIDGSIDDWMYYITRRINSELEDIGSSVRLSDSQIELIRELCFYPIFNGLGHCVEYVERDMNAYNHNNPPTRKFDTTLADGKLVISPRNYGVTDYSGVTESSHNYVYPTSKSKLGSVGYAIFIPLRVVITYGDSTLATYDLIERDSLSVNTYSFTDLIMDEQFTRTRRTLKAPSYSNKTGYDAADVILSSQDTLNLQNKFNSLLEASAVLLKYNRNTNDILIINPSGHVDPQHIISKSLWRKVWHEDKFMPCYKRVVATWESEGVSNSTVYNVVPEEELQYYKDLGDYDVSSNELVKTYGLGEAVVQQIGNVLSNILYYPTSIDMRALPYMEAGDIISVVTGENESFNTICMRHRVSGMQSLSDEIESR